MGSERKRKLDAYSKLVDVPRTLLRRVSHLRTCLLATLDALDDLQTPHAHELHALTEEHFKYHQQAKVYERLWREAEAEKADMRGAVAGLVEKVEQCNDYSQWPYSRLRIASYAAPALRSPPATSLPWRTSGNPYEASLITTLRRDLHAEKSAHEDTHPCVRLPEAGDVFEDARRIEEKLDRSQPTAPGLHAGDGETDADEDAPPLVLPVSRAAVAISHAPPALPLPPDATPTVQCPPPFLVAPSLNGAGGYQEDELPAATDAEGGGPRSHLLEEFEKEVESLGRDVDVLRKESGVLSNGCRADGICRSPTHSPSQPLDASCPFAFNITTSPVDFSFSLATSMAESSAPTNGGAPNPRFPITMVDTPPQSSDIGNRAESICSAHSESGNRITHNSLDGFSLQCHGALPTSPAMVNAYCPTSPSFVPQSPSIGAISPFDISPYNTSPFYVDR
ncbi:hypothetical protein BDN71DRAFT_1594735 [Pleurotus eryngii]|uniref:Uncharacterized protein n=1 Tax=Pleurotus eryngii TaxID=5323 RepID=A0A9P5ZJA3_PLEER|nr:hypothetical protein BDN71DRAFT_1594735 [Pleurotus eryngii]